MTQMTKWAVAPEKSVIAQILIIQHLETPYDRNDTYDTTILIRIE